MSRILTTLARNIIRFAFTNCSAMLEWVMNWIVQLWRFETVRPLSYRLCLELEALGNGFYLHIMPARRDHDARSRAQIREHRASNRSIHHMLRFNPRLVCNQIFAC